MRLLLKILLIIMVIWIVSLWTLVHEFIFGNRVILSEDSQLHNQELNRFRNKYWNGNASSIESNFKVWNLFEPANNSLSEEEKLSIIQKSKIPPGIVKIGENGTPVLLKRNPRRSLKIFINKGWIDHAFNQFVSDLIPINRTLPDYRDEWCKKQIYPKKMPKISVVICFHNEAWSTLLRTFHSVIMMTPSNLLKEIILFDDFSNMDHLMKPLEHYVRKISKIILIRLNNRQGLIRSRILAIKHATAPVIVYLDSHCECSKGWIEPLLARIMHSSRTIATPLVDQIHDSTFEYIPQDTNDLHIGGFDWNLKFIWSAIPRDVLIKRKVLASPIKTPTISGGLFAISKRYFEKLGYYDEAFNIWGAENLELSFKVWMCGGSLEIVPCSHVGHVFRKRVPYKGEKGSLRKNLVRLAEVWMDEYAKYYYERIGNDKGNYGNVSNRKVLRNKLKCKSFEWYLNNVYPQLQLPDEYVARGQISSISNYGICMDGVNSFQGNKKAVNLLPCHYQGGNQYWVYTKDGEIQHDDMCLDYLFNLVTLFICRGRDSSQIWIYENTTNRIKHMATRKCLQIVKYGDRLDLILQRCNSKDVQKWTMENYSIEKFAPGLLTHAKRQP